MIQSPTYPDFRFQEVSISVNMYLLLRIPVHIDASFCDGLYFFIQ